MANRIVRLSARDVRFPTSGRLDGSDATNKDLDYSATYAVWDLWARAEGKPVWRLLSDMAPEQFVDCADLRYVTDVLTRDEALAMVERHAATRNRRTLPEPYSFQAVHRRRRDRRGPGRC